MLCAIFSLRIHQHGETQLIFARGNALNALNNLASPWSYYRYG